MSSVFQRRTVRSTCAAANHFPSGEMLGLRPPLVVTATGDRNIEWQLVKVNGKRVDIPSYRLRKGEVVSLGDKAANMIVIQAGLDGTETVVVEGLQKVRSGMVVAPSPVKPAAKPVTEPAA